MELKITKEKVLDAASKCSTAKAILEVLFPEAFQDKFNSNKIYAMQGSSSKFKLHKVKGSLKDEDHLYAWCDCETTEAYAHGIGFPVDQCLEYARKNRKLFVFDDLVSFAKWLLDE